MSNELDEYFRKLLGRQEQARHNIERQHEQAQKIANEKAEQEQRNIAFARENQRFLENFQRQFLNMGIPQRLRQVADQLNRLTIRSETKEDGFVAETAEKVYGANLRVIYDVKMTTVSRKLYADRYETTHEEGSTFSTRCIPGGWSEVVYLFSSRLYVVKDSTRVHSPPPVYFNVISAFDESDGYKGERVFNEGKLGYFRDLFEDRLTVFVKRVVEFSGKGA